MSKELDAIFADETKPAPKKGSESVKMRPVMSAPKSLDDIFGGGPMEKPRAFTAEEKAQGRKDIETYVGAPLLGATSGITGGYAERAYSPEMLRVMEENPTATGVGKFAGAIAPGMAISRLVGLASKVPGLASLGRTGLRQGAATGAAEGLLTDPGEDGSRTERMLWGSGLGSGLGLSGKFVSKAAEQADIFSRLNKSGFAKDVKGEIDSALDKLLQRQVTPRKTELNRLLQGKTIELNPEYLKGFKRPATLGSVRQKGGLDRLANLLQQKAQRTGSSRAPISGKSGQRLKEYFDSISNYSKQKPFSETATATGERSKAVADLLRGKLSSLDQRVSELNEPMSEALRLRQNIRATSESDPIGTVIADPSTSKGQQILELDDLAGTNLSRRGSNIADAKRLRIRPENLFGIEALKSIARAGKLGFGKAAKVTRADKAPEGTKEALIAKILDSIKHPYSSEEE